MTPAIARVLLRDMREKLHFAEFQLKTWADCARSETSDAIGFREKRSRAGGLFCETHRSFLLEQAERCEKSADRAERAAARHKAEVVELRLAIADLERMLPAGEVRR